MVMALYGAFTNTATGAERTERAADVNGDNKTSRERERERESFYDSDSYPWNRDNLAIRVYPETKHKFPIL